MRLGGSRSEFLRSEQKNEAAARAASDTVVCRDASLRGTFTNNRARVPRALAQGRMSLHPAGRCDLPPRTARLPSETSAASPHHSAYGTRLSGQVRPALDFDSLLERRKYGAASCETTKRKRDG